MQQEEVEKTIVVGNLRKYMRHLRKVRIGLLWNRRLTNEHTTLPSSIPMNTLPTGRVVYCEGALDFRRRMSN